MGNVIWLAEFAWWWWLIGWARLLGRKLANQTHHHGGQNSGGMDAIAADIVFVVRAMHRNAAGKAFDRTLGGGIGGYIGLALDGSD